MKDLTKQVENRVWNQVPSQVWNQVWSQVQKKNYPSVRYERPNRTSL